jgi:hypothetical protein
MTGPRPGTREPTVVLQAEEVEDYAWHSLSDAPNPKPAAKLNEL